MSKKSLLYGLMLFGFINVAACRDNPVAKKRMRPEDLPTAYLISVPGSSFVAGHVKKAATIVAYGDQRFTDPANTKVTNPKARRWLVEKIAQEAPDAVLMNGDVPYNGDVENDYQIFHEETKRWRDEHLNVYPALGNHEFHGDPQQALDHWWAAFPELKDRRWYSVEVGNAIYTISLDSDASLLPGSDQAKWLDAQLNGLPKNFKFVIISLHHPPVADFQTRIAVDHNPRPNEIALRDYLEKIAPHLKARIVVSAGHIHNYERTVRGGVTYLVSGGGGASPVQVERTPEDLYQSNDFPNYHYVEFALDGNTLRGKMVRLADANANTPSWQVRDEFAIEAK